jgi:hypothetical protein
MPSVLAFANPNGIVLVEGRRYIAQLTPPVIPDQPVIGFRTTLEARAFIAGVHHACYAAVAKLLTFMYPSADAVQTVLEVAPSPVVIATLDRDGNICIIA